ncbi:hypothetical protein BJV77DRAFT_1060672 [Russula vinacea]|nr:hypothetical protein BJV77DRAFT_1060672 [Russula vinacea]
MIVTTLRRTLCAPRRRLATSPFSSTSTPLSSTSSSSSSSASASASAAQKKAQDALGNLSAAVVRAGAYARTALGPFGTRLSGLLGSYQQPIRYNLSVTREVLKHIYTAERLQPPTSFGAVLGTYSTLWARARSIGSGEYARLGVYAIEAYGIFKSLVGYNLQ